MKRHAIPLIAMLAVISALPGCRGGGTHGGADPARTTAVDGSPDRQGDVHRSSTTDDFTDQRPDGARLRGKVLFRGAHPERQRAMVVKDVAVCGKIDHLDDRLVVDAAGGVMNAVVSVRGVRGGKPLASMGKEFVLDQRSCAYLPHVLLVPVGGAVKIVNEDGVLHNIHTYSTLNRPFNVAQPRVLREIQKSFSTPERIAVRCDVHGWMSSWVIVVDNPYHVLTDEHGNFELSGIPDGRYTVECWQEELGEMSAEVTIGGPAGEVLHDFVYPPRPVTVNTD